MDLLLYEDKKQTYLKSLDSLYEDIKVWLGGYGADVVQIEQREELVYDSGINTYYAPMLQVRFLKINELVAFYPKGAILLAADGKVEVWSRFSHVELLEKPTNHWKIRKENSLVLTPLDETSFADMIADLLGR